MNPITGYPETVFSAANFFGPTPPRQVGNGPALVQSGDSVSPPINWHTAGILALIIVGGYAVWHIFGLGE